MNKSMTLVLISFLLACTSLAAPLQLSGDSGKAILGAINLTNSTNETNITDETELWDWGKLPLGYSLNASGKLAANPVNDDGLVVVPPRSDSIE